jgi:hypothetical protein
LGSRFGPNVIGNGCMYPTGGVVDTAMSKKSSCAGMA